MESHDRATIGRRRSQAFLCRIAIRQPRVYQKSQSTRPKHDTVCIQSPAFPIFNSISYYDNGGNQHYHGLQATVAKNYGDALTFNAGYTWAKDLTDTQEGTFTGQTIQNQFDRRAEYGNNLADPNASGVWIRYLHTSVR